MSATAPFACHVILDSSQSSLSVVYKQLSFLREDKRKVLLKSEDPNISEAFIRLYAMNSFKHPALFTCAAKTFTGYAQPSSYLEEENYKEKNPDFFEKDIYLAERNAILEDFKPLSKVTAIEKNGFDFWQKSQPQNKAEEKASDDIQKLIVQRVEELRKKDGYIKVSATHLRTFFECERRYLFNNIIGLKELDNEASLMDQFARGSLKHRILELFLNTLKEKDQTLRIENEELPEEHIQSIKRCIAIAINEKSYGNNKNSYLARELLNTTAEAFFAEMVKTITALAFVFEGFSVYGTELHFNYIIEEKKLLLDGFIDCLLQNPEDGGFVLIDFKSSKNAIPAVKTEEDMIKNPDVKYPDFQMPMYLYLLQNQKKMFPVDRCLFFNIKDAKAVPIDLEGFNPIMNRFLLALDEYAECIEKQLFFENPKKDFSECNSCAYRALCRKVFTVGKDY